MMDEFEEEGSSEKLADLITEVHNVGVMLLENRVALELGEDVREDMVLYLERLDELGEELRTMLTH